MSTRSAPQVLSRKNEYNLRFLNFLVMGLRNSVANYSSSEIIPVSACAEVSFDFLSKHL